MTIQLTGKTRSVYQDKDDSGWWGWYYISVWYKGSRYISNKIEFENVKNHDDIPWQDEPVSVEFDIETKEITIL